MIRPFPKILALVVAATPCSFHRFPGPTRPRISNMRSMFRSRRSLMVADSRPRSDHALSRAELIARALYVVAASTRDNADRRNGLIFCPRRLPRHAFVRRVNMNLRIHRHRGFAARGSDRTGSIGIVFVLVFLARRLCFRSPLAVPH